ncbi:MAG: CotH kinase family protein, partial [Prevotella sp.]|nr:CotH kinase family protein [Prevotella sp.]
MTDVPTIYIDIDGITDETSLGNILYKIRKNSADDEEIAPYSTAIITVVDNSAVGSKQHLESFTDEVQIKVRGNSTASAGNGKVPYRLKFAKKGEDGISHKHDLLGHGYAKRNWTLIANTYDRSMLRNAITYHIGKYVGMDFCPGYKFVDLVISGLYRGTYMVSDHCETGTNRVEVANEDTDWYLEFTGWGSMAESPYVGQGDGDDHFVTIKNPELEDEASINQLKADVQAWRKEWKAS